MANNVPSIKTPVLLEALRQTDPKIREQKLSKFIKDYFGHSNIKLLYSDKVLLSKLLIEYNVENRVAFGYFAESIYQQRLLNLGGATTNLLAAINAASKNADHYLLYYFFNYYAFSLTDGGNTIDAVQSFRRAKKEAILINDYYSQVIVDINISDIYYKNGFFIQSIFYLNQAQEILVANQVTDPRLLNIIYYNKAENYFRMNKIDSLKKYNALLNDPQCGSYKIYIFRNRTNYYLSILNNDYSKAIKAMKALRTDTLYKFDDTDEQNLANAYYKANMPDSARYIINHLLTKSSQNNHPETKFHLYGMLGDIAEKKNDDKQAAYNFKMALQQSVEQINRLTQVGNISSQMNIEEMQNTYIQKEEAYKRQRMWLIFIVVVSVLTIATGGMLYRNITQKRYYEKLLFFAKKEELAFINSHEVRRHLSNILGIVDMIRHSDNKDKDYKEAENHLLQAAENLDEAIKNISHKLDS
ncbi:MAG: hypothetical protein ABIN91_14175 [Mucilaginibacter sp.]|uniref:hypothetical protein n=1 Tax=Mucilaginibacter sp. TaxID=1882438 RepID=UPI0032665164